MAVLHLDYMSQPSRAIALFCRLNQLQITEHEVIIAKGQNRTQEMLSLNPIGKLPFLQVHVCSCTDRPQDCTN